MRRMWNSLRMLIVALMVLVGFGACASLKEKCVKLDIGEGGRVSLPNTAWFNSNLGSAEGPVKMESCPLPIMVDSKVEP